MKKITWRSLNEILASLNESEVLTMLELERVTEKRLSVLLRLHQRYNILRAGRERSEIFKVAIPSEVKGSVQELHDPTNLKILPIKQKKVKEEKILQPKIFLLNMVNNRSGHFSKGIIGSPFHKICDQLSREFPNEDRVTQSDLILALKTVGWIDRGRVNSRDLNAKKQVYICPELDHLSKSELRRLL
jgi:hypothetical protein